MAKRALIPGDLVCIRHECVKLIRATGTVAVDPHVPCEVLDRQDNGRGRMYLTIKIPRSWDSRHDSAWVWPSQVRLADGAEERLWRREQKRIAEIEAMKERRRRERVTRRRRKEAA